MKSCFDVCHTSLLNSKAHNFSIVFGIKCILKLYFPTTSKKVNHSFAIYETQQRF